MDAIVLGGGRIKGEFAAMTGQEIKALLEINGRTLLERTLTALARSESVDRIATVGPPAVRDIAEAGGAGLYVPEERSAIDNLLAGMKALGVEGRVLVSTSDLVVVEPGDVDDFVRRVPKTAGVSYAVFSRSEYRAAFPTLTKESFVAVRDGRFTGGCMFVASTEILRRIAPTLQSLFRARKIPVAMVWRVGLITCVRFALSYLLGPWLAPTTEEFKARVEGILGCEAAIVRGASPHLGLDVDTRQDWEFVKAYVQEQEGKET